MPGSSFTIVRDGVEEQRVTETTSTGLDLFGDDRTVVTHTHDWSEVTDPEILARADEVSADEMRETLRHLEAALA